MGENKNIEEQYREQIAAVIDEKKRLEQQLHEKKEKIKQLEKNIENQREANAMLLEKNNALLHNTIRTFLSARKRCIQEETELINRGIEYWSPVFDAKYYAEEYADIKNTVGTDERQLLNHFIQLGVFEGRIASEDFDVQRYMKLNSDVAAAFQGDYRAACIHYIEKGQFESRKK